MYEGKPFRRIVSAMVHGAGVNEIPEALRWSVLTAEDVSIGFGVETLLRVAEREEGEFDVGPKFGSQLGNCERHLI